MIRNMHPVEELFEIRAQLRALKAREAELRAFFLADPPPATMRGPLHAVAISRQRRRVFQRARLAPEILADSRYWQIKTSPVVRVTPPPEGISTGSAHGFSDRDRPFAPPSPDDALFEPFY